MVVVFVVHFLTPLSFFRRNGLYIAQFPRKLKTGCRKGPTSDAVENLTVGSHKQPSRMRYNSAVPRSRRDSTPAERFSPRLGREHTAFRLSHKMSNRYQTKKQNLARIAIVYF